MGAARWQGRSGAGLPVPAVVVTCLAVLVAGWWARSPCLDLTAWARGVQYSGYCYTDVVPLWFGRGLADGAGPYGAQPLEYPPVLAVRIWLAAVLAHALPGDPALWTFSVTNGLLVVLESLAVLVLLRRLGLPPSRLVWWAAAPPLFLYAFYNWDVLPLVLLLGALLLHRDGRDTAAGAVAGLGAAAKVFPGFLVPLVVLALLARGRRGAALRHGAAALGAWAAVQLPPYLLARDGWARFYELSSERGMHVDSVWYLLFRLGGPALSPSALSVASAAVFGLGAVVVVVLGVRNRPPEDWWQLLVPVLVCFLLANKVYSPQYTLWLVPLLALVLRRAAPFLALVAADLAVHAVEFPFLGGRSGFGAELPYPLLGTAVAVRAAVLCWILVEVVRRPTPVEREGGPQFQEGSQNRSSKAS